MSEKLQVEGNIIAKSKNKKVIYSLLLFDIIFFGLIIFQNKQVRNCEQKTTELQTAFQEINAELEVEKNKNEQMEKNKPALYYSHGIDKSSWLNGQSEEFLVSFQYPPKWSVIATNDKYDNFIKIKSNDQSDQIFQTNGLYIGSPLIFSTGGSLCGNALCSPILQIEVEIMEEKYSAEVIFNREGMHRFQFSVPSNKGEIYITGDYDTFDELEQLLGIISTIKKL